ncbi:MAG TPA: hypothetical protein PLZ31_11400 [Myxococcota bacterium]|nr:hypothetical protein [Myxococcota bacterium]
MTLRVTSSAFIFAGLVALGGCIPVQGDDDADSIDRDAAVDVRIDSHVQPDAYDDASGIDVSDSDALDTVDDGDAPDVFVCDRPAGKEWQTFVISECGGVGPPACFTWTLEHDSMSLAYPDDYGVEQTTILPVAKFVEIDCIISSLEFQGMMNDGFVCSDIQVIDDYFDFALTLADETRLNQDVNACLHDFEHPNLALTLKGKVM